MRFAQTIVDDPKYGASRRDAVISVASAPMPAPKTSAPSATLPGRSGSGGSRHLEPEDALDLAERPRGQEHGHGDDDHEQDARSEHWPTASRGGASPAPRVARGEAGTLAMRHGIERRLFGSRLDEPRSCALAGPRAEF